MLVSVRAITLQDTVHWTGTLLREIHVLPTAKSPDYEVRDFECLGVYDD